MISDRDEREKELRNDIFLPTPQQLLARLEKGTAPEERKKLSRKILLKAKNNKEFFNENGPAFLSSNIENELYALPDIANISNDRDIQFQPIKAQEWIIHQKENAMVAINANAEIVCGHVWNYLAQEEAIAQESDLPLHMPRGYGDKYTYSNKKNEMGLEAMGGSYRVTNIKQYALNDKNKDGVQQTGTYDAVFVAAPDFRNPANYKDLGDPQKREAYIRQIAARVRMQCEHAIQNGNTILAAGALGCGAFQNNPFLIAAIYRAVLNEPKYKNFKVDFVIMDKSLCNNFQKVFEAPKEEIAQILQVSKPFDAYSSAPTITYESYIDHLPKPTPDLNKTQNLTKSDRRYKVMSFHNNYLKGVAEGNPEKYLIGTQKIWYSDIIQKYQPSLKVYLNKKYVNDINPAFDRPGNYPVNEFFNAYSQSPQNIITHTDYDKLKKAASFAPEYDEKETAYSRQFTKYRVLVSKVPFLGEDGQLHERNLITTCAPNLMASSEVDSKKYLIYKGNDQNKHPIYQLNAKEYKESCNEIAQLIIFAAKDNNISPLDIAEFGLGVYLNQFKNNPSQKTVARDIMYQAFKDAAEQLKVEVNWLIHDTNPNADSIVESNNTKYSGDFFKFSKGDILNSKNSLNNGSDRTIGGHSNNAHAKTTEEQVFQESFLLETQTNCNPHHYKNIIIVNLNTNEKEIAKSSLTDANVFHDAIPNNGGLQSVQLGGGTEKANRFVQLHFNDQQTAEGYAAYLLKQHQIHKYKKPAETVNIKPNPETNTFIIRLNNIDYNKLVNDDQAYFKLLLHTFINEEKLDLSRIENRVYWTQQVGDYGKDIPEYNIKVPQITKTIHNIYLDNKMSDKNKIEKICDELNTSAKYNTSSIFNPIFTIGRSDATQRLIDNAKKLELQFKELNHEQKILIQKK